MILKYRGTVILESNSIDEYLPKNEGDVCDKKS